MRIKDCEVMASAKRLKDSLRLAISTVLKVESFSIEAFVQHVLSFLIFSVALMIDYKGNEARTIYPFRVISYCLTIDTIINLPFRNYECLVHCITFFC